MKINRNKIKIRSEKKTLKQIHQQVKFILDKNLFLHKVYAMSFTTCLIKTFFFY